MELLLPLLLAAALPPDDGSVEGSGPIVAIVGEVARPASYRMPQQATMGDLMRVGEASVPAAGDVYPANVSLVRKGQMMRPVPVGHLLADGDVLLVSPAFRGTTRTLAILTRGRAPLVINVPETAASESGLTKLLSLSPADGGLQIAPPPAAGELADGSAVLLSSGEAGARVYAAIVPQCRIYDVGAAAPQVAAAPANPASPGRPTVAATSVSLRSTATNADSSVATPLPGMASAGPMRTAAVTPSSAGGIHLPRATAEPTSGQPIRSGVTPVSPFSIPVLVASPELSQPTFSQVTSPQMETVPNIGPMSVRPASPPWSTPPVRPVSSAAKPSPEPARLPPMQPIRQTAGVAATPTTVVTPRPLGQIQATPLAEIGPLEPTPTRLGGVMFAAIVLVVVCGGLVLWTRGTPMPAAVAASETPLPLPVTIAPIVEEPAQQMPPAAMHGEVVGLDKLRVDAAHPIAPPHYSREAADADAKQTADADTPSEAPERTTAGGAPVRGPRYARGSRPKSRQLAAATSITTASGSERPSDLLARAVQAMQREVRRGDAATEPSIRETDT